MTTLATTAPALDARGALPRTYHVRTLGCQMNVHDSEHMAGLLEDYEIGRASCRERV